MKNSSLREHAIVVGGGIGGLVCARVLCDHFSKVTIVEKDTFPKTPEPRKGIPQGHYLHILLAKGIRTLDELFPELLSSLEADGAVKLNVGTDLAAKMPQGWMPKYQSDIWLYACSRPFLEWHIHKQLTDNNKIEFIEQSKVDSLLLDHDKKSVIGVSLQQKECQKNVYADIVVDASGRSSKAGEWLENLGFPKPEETVIEPRIIYSGRLYKKPANFQADWKSLAVYPYDSENPCGGFVYPVENDRWMVTLSGVGKTPSREDALFLEFARNLSVPDIYNAIKDAEPISPIYSYRRTINRIRHFEKLEKRPECFFALGDSVCSYNPVYGQGMTSAILGAVAFGELLTRYDQDLTYLAEEFQEKLAKINFTIWQRGSIDDIRWSESSSENNDLKKEIIEKTKFMDRILELATRDTKTAELLWNVLHILKPANALLDVGIHNKLAALEAPKPVSNIWYARVKPGGLTANTADANEAVKKTIGELAANKEFKKLAQLWVQGHSIDWQSLHPENTPQRLHLPTYPFAKEKFFISKANNKRIFSDKESSNFINSLLHKNIPDISESVSSADHKVANSEKYIATEKPSLTTRQKIELFLKQAIANQLNKTIDEIEINRGYFELGLDSLGFIMIVEKIQDVIGEKLPPTILFEYVTVEQLSDYFSEKYSDRFDRLNIATLEADENKIEEHINKSQAGLASVKAAELNRTGNGYVGNTFDSQERLVKNNASTAASTFPELIHLNKTRQGRPIFWIHGGLGGVQPYHVIAENLQRPFYGIQALGKRGRAFAGIKAIASHYINVMQSVQPKGPYDIGGYSLGGLISYEMTRQLQELGETVSSIIMLDTLDTSALEKIKISKKSQQLLAVNFALASRVIQEPKILARTLIHRKEINSSLEPDLFKRQLIDVAMKKGLITEAQLNEKLEQMAIEEDEYKIEDYSLMPLPLPESVDCYYFRNKSGMFFGKLEPYFVISRSEYSVDHTNYWELWKKLLPNFEIIDVDASNHMALLSEPKVYKAIIEFCNTLYSGKPITESLLQSLNTKNSKPGGISRFLLNFTRPKDRNRENSI
jgi:thioesterase domain-containing protein/flavin-dependent dehydrogenase/acyl carrier protein